MQLALLLLPLDLGLSNECAPKRYTLWQYIMAPFCMKSFGNTSRVWQTALPGATTRTAAVFLAGQAHHTASPLRLFQSGEWFLFAGSQTPLTGHSSSLSSVWVSAHWPQDKSFKPFDLFPYPSCWWACGWMRAKEGKHLVGYGGGLKKGYGKNGGHFEGTALCGL